MNKIICEICGTAYSDSAEDCPICGYPRPQQKPEQEPAAENAAQPAERVRGGKFSKQQVKVRQHNEEPADEEVEAEPQASSNRGLKVTALVLLIAVILVSAYIILRFVAGADAYKNATEPTAPSTSQTQPSESVPADTSVACTDLKVEGISFADGVEFRGKGRAWRMSIVTEPADTTDEVTVTSSDESVVQVSQTDDRLELVSAGPGKATITLTCGSVTKTFVATCSFDADATVPSESTQPSTAPGTEPTTAPTTEPTTAPTTEPTTAPTTEPTTAPTETLPNITLELNRKDFSMFVRGDKWQLYDGKIPRDQITWSSSNTKVATVEDGLVKAVGAGHCVITATYNGQEVKCDVYCQF